MDEDARVGHMVGAGKWTKQVVKEVFFSVFVYEYTSTVRFSKAFLLHICKTHIDKALVFYLVH